MLAIRCVAALKDNQDEVIIGTETGYIIRCTNRNAKTSSKLWEFGKSPNPVVFSYRPHLDSCECISFSPFHRNLFLSCSLDGTVSLFHILKRDPILTWELTSAVGAGVQFVQWSKSKPTVFCCTSSNGSTYIYNLAISSSSPATVISPPQNQNGRTGGTPKALSSQFNPKRNELLAVAMENGKVNIWRLKSSLTQAEISDQAVLDSFGNISL